MWHNDVPIIQKFIRRGGGTAGGGGIRFQIDAVSFALLQSVTPNFDLTAVPEKRCSVNGEVSPLRAEIVRKIDRNRNQRIQRQASPPRAVGSPSLEFVTAENKTKG